MNSPVLAQLRRQGAAIWPGKKQQEVEKQELVNPSTLYEYLLHSLIWWPLQTYLITLHDSRERQKLGAGDFKHARVAEGITKL